MILRTQAPSEIVTEADKIAQQLEKAGIKVLECMWTGYENEYVATIPFGYMTELEAVAQVNLGMVQFKGERFEWRDVYFTWGQS